MTAAIVLGGGQARRLDGADKAAVVVDGRALVDHVFAVVTSCRPLVAVGPPSLGRPGVTVVREEPAFAGPAAAAVRGLAAVETADPATQETWLLACDLPRAGELVRRLSAVAVPEDMDGVIAVDEDGRMQWLAGRYRVAALRSAAEALPDVAGTSLHALLGGLRLRTVAVGAAAIDLDTWPAIEDYRNAAGRRERHPEREDHHD